MKNVQGVAGIWGFAVGQTGRHCDRGHGFGMRFAVS